MPADDHADSRVASWAAALQQGFDLRDAGHSAEALDMWDQLLAADIGPAGADIQQLAATASYAKAHLLLTLGRAAEAEIAAQAAAAAAASVTGGKAAVLAAHAMEVQRSALTALNELDRAREIDERLAHAHADSENFELRLCALRGLQHEIWVLVAQHDEAQGIVCARRLVAMFCADTDPRHLIQTAEVVLSSAETLRSRSRLWRRPSASVDGEARAMCEAVIEQADRVGGDIGGAVTLNARIAAADALARNRQLLASYRDRRTRPAVKADELGALEQVQETAHAAGAEGRYFTLSMLRATALADLGRRDEAREAFDTLLAHLNATGGASSKGMAALVTAIRKTVT